MESGVVGNIFSNQITRGKKLQEVNNNMGLTRKTSIRDGKANTVFYAMVTIAGIKVLIEGERDTSPL